MACRNFIAFGFFLCLMCPDAHAADLSQFTLPRAHRVIISADKGPDLIAQCSRDAPVAKFFWEPTEDDIDGLERLLLQDKDAIAQVDHAAFAGQYVGFIRDGRKFIYGNFYPAEMDIDGRANPKPAVTCDGGAAFWGIVYNVQTKVFTDLSFNGSL